MEAAKRSEGINEVGANEFHTFILFATDLNKRQQAMQSVIRIRNPYAIHSIMHRVKPKQSDIDNVLIKLRDVMLYDTSVQPKHEQPIPTPTPTRPKHEQQPKPTPTPMQPKHEQQPKPTPTPMQSLNDNRFRPALNQDPLFWCLYIMKHGAFKYDQLPNRFTAEQDGKRDEIMMLRDKGKALKQTTGIKFTVSAIEGDIMSPRISLHAFQVLVHLNSLNAVFVNPANRVYAEFISDAVSDKPVHVIERSIQNPKQMVMTMTPATEPQLTSIRATNYRIENLQKPIKSSSAYTVPVLTEMCHQLKMPLNNAKMKKQELYDAIAAKLVL
jgi:hypothetical protein